MTFVEKYMSVSASERTGQVATSVSCFGGLFVHVMVLVGTATFTAGVVMLLRAKRVRHHFSQTPRSGTDHHEMVDEGENRAPLGAGVCEEVDKQDRQTDKHTKHYQKLDLAKMEKRTMQLSKLDCIVVRT